MEDKIKQIILKHSRNGGDCLPDYEYESTIKEIIGLFSIPLDKPVKPEIANIEKIIEFAFKKGEDWGVCYSTWFTPDDNKQKAKLRNVIIDTKEQFGL